MEHLYGSTGAATTAAAAASGAGAQGSGGGLLCNMDQLLHTAMEVVATPAVEEEEEAGGGGGEGGGDVDADLPEPSWPRYEGHQPVDLSALDGIDLDFPPLMGDGGGAPYSSASASVHSNSFGADDPSSGTGASLSGRGIHQKHDRCFVRGNRRDGVRDKEDGTGIGFAREKLLRQ